MGRNIRIGQVWEFRNAKDGSVHTHNIVRIDKTHAWSREGFGGIALHEMGTGPVPSGMGEFVFVSEPDYVVKYGGRYWRDGYGRTTGKQCKARRYEESDARQVVGNTAVDGRGHRARVVRLKPRKPKPKAPREVRIIVRGGVACEVVNEARAHEGIRLAQSESVVRYVLAEGE